MRGSLFIAILKLFWGYPFMLFHTHFFCSMYSYALSFYVTKTVLVGTKWFWSDQIDLVLTTMIWSWPEWIGPVQMWFFLVENCNFDLTNSFWLWPFHFGQDQIIIVKSKSILVRPKPFWTNQNCSCHIEGQGIRV